MNTGGEYSPLCPCGFCDIAEDDLERIFVGTPKLGNEKRMRLYLGFREWLQAIKEIGIPLEVWVDGSFATEKPDPGDVDIVCIAAREDVRMLKLSNPDALARFRGLFAPHDTKSRYFCHAFLMYGEKADWEYWTGLFGRDRCGAPKGMFRIFLGGKR